MWFSTLLLKNLLRRKFRSGLTCIGFAVAVGTTVALLGVSDSFERTWLKSMTERSFDIIVSEANIPDAQMSQLDESFESQIAKIPGVKTVSPNLVDIISWHEGDKQIDTLLTQGWKPGSVMFDKLNIVKGRRYKPGEDHVILLGKQVAQYTNKTVGDTMTIQDEKFKVLGIYESFVHYENGGVILPLKTLQNLTFRKNVTGFALVLEDSYKDEAGVNKVCDTINNMKFESQQAGRPVSLSALPAKDFVQSSFQIQVAHAMAWITSTIAVIVGSIGVLNTMVMSVVERVREISILRAIGWKKSRVVRMILGEALILSLMGAALGIGGAILLVHWLTTLPVVSGYIAGTIANVVLIEGVLLALVVGLLGGAYPAWRAAQLLPSEGLRHE